jgi:hypothetical protein
LSATHLPAAQDTTTRFLHHLHLDSIDPAAAIEWYTNTFPVPSRAVVAGYEGIASEQIHLLFTRTSIPPRATLDSAIWHVGSGSPDARRLCDASKNGVKFATPLHTLPQGTVFAYERT